MKTFFSKELTWEALNSFYRLQSWIENIYLVKEKIDSSKRIISIIEGKSYDIKQKEKDLNNVKIFLDLSIKDYNSTISKINAQIIYLLSQWFESEFLEKFNEYK